MGKINWGRVVLGGVVAAVVLNLLGYFWHAYYFGVQLDAALRALGVAMSARIVPALLLLAFVRGIALMWLYASARPRYGAGVRTAVIAGVAFWLIADALPSADSAAMGLFPARLMTTGSLFGLVAFIVASIAGAAVYKES